MRKSPMLGATALVTIFAVGSAAPLLAEPPVGTLPTDRPGIVLTQERTGPGTPGQAPDQRAQEAARERLERLTAAQPAAQSKLSADAVIGTEIRNTQDQKLGSVKDLVVNEGKVVALILSRGGVLGMGTSYHQIDMAQAKITADGKTVVLDLAEEQVKALPKVAYEAGAWKPEVAEKDAEKDAAPPPAAPGAPPSQGEPPAKSE